jgi:hypothetical protein
MSQHARPVVDITRTNWADPLGGTTNLAGQISEEIANDSEYIETGLAPTNAVYVAKLSSVTDPQASTGHVLRYHFRKNADAGDQIDFTVQLRQGYVNESSQGTLIKQVAHTNAAGTGWIAGSVTLSGPEADSIGDYTGLFLRVLANTP